MIDRRREVGEWGESLAVAFLRRHGLRVVACNVEVAGGEVDIVATEGHQRVVVEVRTITGEGDPLAAFDHAKAARVRRLAAVLGADRVDLVAIRLTAEGVELRWVRAAA